MLIDLHTHTQRWSWDSSLDPHELIEAAKEAGLDGIALTEHDFFWPVEDTIALSKQHNFVVLPGVEINTEDGHFLCYGIDRYVFGMHRAARLAELVSRAGGAVIAAHPYRRQIPTPPHTDAAYASRLEAVMRKAAYAACVAIETVNGRGTDRENEFSIRLADLLSAPQTAGSDSHQRTDLGRCATEFLHPVSDLAGLIEELQAGRFRPVTLRPRDSSLPD